MATRFPQTLRSGPHSERSFFGIAGFRALSSLGFTLTTGGTPKAPIPTGIALISTDTYGNLKAGENWLITGPNPSTGRVEVPDFLFSQNSLRLFTRNLTLTEIDDPPDLTFRRAGPNGGYPWVGGNGTAVADSSTTSVTVFNANPAPLLDFKAGHRLRSTSSAKIPSATTIVSVTPVDANNVTLTLSGAINVQTGNTVFSIGSTADLTAVDSGGTIGQVRCVPFVAPYNGTLATPGAQAIQVGASMGFRLAELSRSLTPDSGTLAIGTNIRWQTAKVGRADMDDAMQLCASGNLQIGQGAVVLGDTGQQVQARLYAGQNEQHQLTVSGTPSGTFKLIFYADPPANGYATPATTASITYPPSAANILSAISALTTGSQQCQVAFLTGHTDITIKNPNGQIPVVGATVSAVAIPGGATVIASPAPTATGFSISAATTNNANGETATISAWNLGLAATTVTGGSLPTPIVVEYTGTYLKNHHFKRFGVDNTGLTLGLVQSAELQTGIPAGLGDAVFDGPVTNGGLVNNGALVDHRTPVGDVDYTILPTDRIVAYGTTTASRTASFSAAPIVGQRVLVVDEAGTANTRNLLVKTSGASTIATINTNGGSWEGYWNGVAFVTLALR